MADNSNIFVEFDYQNIIVVDPNKIVDQNGLVKDRLVNHEDLVMYANLECSLTPRTKLRLGIEQNDLQTVEIAKINFLKPGGKKYLNTEYIQLFTGNDQKKPKEQQDTFRFYEPTIDKQDTGVIETSLLGITNINFNVTTAFLPTITVTLEDVRGRALFELGDKSPYAALINLPYPMFYLTLKGYYGKAVRYQLMLQNFNARFNNDSGNFEITLTFLTYKYTVLAEVSMGYLLATPHMFPTTVTQLNNAKNPSAKTVNTTPKNYTLGFQKIKELFDEYKSKGIIEESLPEYTITQLQAKLETFIKDTLKKWGEVNMAPLTNIETYSQDITKYKQEMYYSTDSWFKKNMDTRNFIVLLNKGKKVFISKRPLEENNQIAIRNELSEIIIRNNKVLDTNPVLGKKGTYVVGNKTEQSEINNRLSISAPIPGSTSAVGGVVAQQAGVNTPLPGWVNFNVTQDEIDYKKTYSQRYNKNPDAIENKEDYQKFESELKIIVGQLQPNPDPNAQPPKPPPPDKFYGMENKGEFLDLIAQMEKDLLRTKDDITKKLGDELNKIIKDGKGGGLGFVPTIRNVLAIFFANGEAFLRLMDDCHSEAWSKRDSEIRKKSILGTTPSSEKVDEGFVYPWPQLIKESLDEKGVKSYNVTYPGDPNVINDTQGYIFDEWPEIEFVEEMLGSLFLTNAKDSPFDPADKEISTINRLSLNSIEYPISNIIYQNKEEVKFFYEFWERMGSISNFSRLTRGAPSAYSIEDIIAQTESLNMTNALGTENVFLIKKLKEYDINPTTIRPILKTISNLGEGESFQKYIRGYYSTPYINSYTKKDFRIFDNPIFTTLNQAGENNNKIENLEDLDSYISSSECEEFEFNDTFPFTDEDWNSNYLAGYNNSPNITKNVISYNDSINTIANYDIQDITQLTKRPITFFSYLNSTPINDFFDGVVNSQELKTFYQQRTDNSYVSKNKQLVTEGSITYSDYEGGLVNQQTTSMLNTPYFVNAIQKGVRNFRLNQFYPYKEAAYLFLNSLPLATLKERYKSQESSITTELDYLFACFKKFGSVHRLPYPWVLKYGSLWHRYKKFVQTGEDFLDGIWTDFNYLENYDPASSATTKTYVFTGSGATQETRITLQTDDTFNGLTMTQMDVGFYPKLINDFSVFFNGYNIFTTSASGTGIFSSSTVGFNSNDIQNGINSGVTVNRTSFNFAPFGFDSNNSDRNFILNSYSVTLRDITDSNFYVIPSVGNNFNQSFNECFENINSSLLSPKLKIEPKDNKSLFNGSVRCFWMSPNYGWFDNSQIGKPSHNQYVKQIKSDQDIQDNFNFTKSSEYSYFDELTSVFKKEILDDFEQLFLNFSTSKYKFLPIDSTVQIEQGTSVLMNFQTLFSEMMKLPIDYENTGVFSIQQIQLGNFTSFLKKFMEYDLLFKYGNPSEYDKQLFLSFTIPSPTAVGFNSVVDKIQTQNYTTYTPNAFPNGSNQTTLDDVINNYPDAWKALLLYVGESQVPGIKYSNQGSTVFDFFIDNNIEFSEDNVKSLYPLIKIYATQKKLKSNYNTTSFKTDITKFVDKNNKFQNLILKNTFTKLKKNLGDVNFSEGSNFSSKLIGNQGKVEIWESLKGLNDKWISGYDLKYKTIFEDVLLLDRASRDLGDKVLVDIFELNKLIQNINTTSNLLYYVQSILQMNNFQVMSLPSYVNFYNVQDPIKDAIPKIENSLDFANDMFGTHPNVDYRNSGPKMVCFYAGKPSEHPQVNKPDYAYQDDGIYFQKLDTNTLQDNLVGKKDWGKSNRVVGFTVDMGIQNQNVFTNISVSQDNGKSTSESLQQLTDMANQAGNRSTSTQNTSLYNLYKSRSYGCTIQMIGNAMIQPMMYFNLRHVPMFSGSYMIMRVNHSISSGSFTTQFEGVRQSIFSLPDVDSYIQAALVSIVSTVFNQNKQAAQLPQSKSANTEQEKINQKSPTSTKESTPSQSDSCSANTKFEKFEVITNPTLYKYNDDEVIKALTGITSNLINEKISNKAVNQNLIDKINYVCFCIMNYYSYQKSGLFEAYEHNYGGVRLDLKINGGEKDFGNSRNEKLDKQYACLESNGIQFASASFNSLEDYLKWKIDYIKSKVDTKILNGKTLKGADGTINRQIKDDLAKDIYRFIILNWPFEQDKSTSDSFEKNIETKQVKDEITNVWFIISIAESAKL